MGFITDFITAHGDEMWWPKDSPSVLLASFCSPQIVLPLNSWALNCISFLVCDDWNWFPSDCVSSGGHGAARLLSPLAECERHKNYPEKGQNRGDNSD